MKDHGIMFSGPMVRALIDGRKRQTRRLATSPLAKAEPGDRFWVRETFAKPFRRTPTSSGAIYRCDGPEYLSLAQQAHQWGEAPGRWTPAIHMPRWASRLTLILEDVRIEPLHEISEADAIAEGVTKIPALGEGWFVPLTVNTAIGRATPEETYQALWESLHDKAGERWQDNPDVAVFTFEVRRCNIELVEQ